MRLFDRDFEMEITKKLEALNKRLTQLNEGNEAFYTNVVSKQKVS